MSMAGTPLETKIHIPRRRRSLVARRRLSEQLSRGAESALTLVSAPAGFGKTTLLTEWLAASPVDGGAAAWLSLDPRDNAPAGSRAAYRSGPCHASQRPERHRDQCRVGARRLSRHRRSRCP